MARVGRARLAGLALTAAASCRASAPAPRSVATANQAPADDVPDGEPAADGLPRVALRLHDGAWLPPHELEGRVVVVAVAWFEAAPAVLAATEVLAQIDPGGRRTLALVAPRTRAIAANLTGNPRASPPRVLDEHGWARLGLDGDAAIVIYDRRGARALRMQHVVDRQLLRASVQRLLAPP